MRHITPLTCEKPRATTSSACRDHPPLHKRYVLCYYAFGVFLTGFLTGLEILLTDLGVLLTGGFTSTRNSAIFTIKCIRAMFVAAQPPMIISTATMTSHPFMLSHNELAHTELGTGRLSTACEAATEALKEIKFI